MSLQDLPTELLFSIADALVLSSSLPSSPFTSSSTTTTSKQPRNEPHTHASPRTTTRPTRSSSATRSNQDWRWKALAALDKPTFAALRACAATCRALRGVFRPLVWSRVDISDVVGAALLAGRSASRGCGDTKVGDQGGGEGYREGAGAWAEEEEVEERSSRTLFLHALRTFHALVERSPEVAGYVRVLSVVLPLDGLQSPDQAEEEEGRELEEISELFLTLAHKLENVRKLSVVSYGCTSPRPRGSMPPPPPPPVSSLPSQHQQQLLLQQQMQQQQALLLHLPHPAPLPQPATTTPKPQRMRRRQTIAPLRIDAHTLPPRFLAGLARLLLGTPALRAVELRGVVVPPRVLFDLGMVEEVKLVAWSSLGVEAIEGLDSPASSWASSSMSAFASSSPSSSWDLGLPTAPPRLSTPLTTLHLGYCDAELLRYLTRVYGGALGGVREVSLNVIERDLEGCQWFLDVATSSSSPSSTTSSSPSTSSSSLVASNDTKTERRTTSLEVFDCTIRCNTAVSSYHGPFALHALDFSKCPSAAQGGLRRVSLRYLLLSRVTESVRRAIGWNVRSALGATISSSVGFTEQDSAEEGCYEKGMGTGVGVEEVNLVVDWAGDGDEVLVDTFREVDGIVKDAFTHASARDGEGNGDKMNLNLNLKRLTLEATHWPCVEGARCTFRRAVAPPSPPPPPALCSTYRAFGSTSVSDLLAPASLSASTSPLHPAPVHRRPTPLRTSSSPATTTSASSRSGPQGQGYLCDEGAMEGTLDGFFPFLSSLRGYDPGYGDDDGDGEDGGFAFETRYKLEHRREVGVGM